MFNKVSRLAERATVGLSRRAFFTQLGRIGVGALAFATFVGEAAAANNSCVLNGGCCPPGTYSKGLYCFRDSKCKVGRGACVTSSRCCGGTGACLFGVCYADQACNTPC
jgi:hypothetical protein